MTFKEQFNLYKCYIDNRIEVITNNLDTHSDLKNSLSYSLKAGGKRIRPIMFIATLEALGINYEKYVDLAVAIECIHTYSLIHDDLPALDNDDYRRGKLSNHKAFGEGMAILAGDALLNLAIELALNCIDSRGALNAVKLLFNYSGVYGMLNGQAHDLAYENTVIENSEQALLKLDELKTGKLLTAPLVMASLIAEEKYLDELTQLGQLTGTLFQLTDDLLDVVGSFENMGKTLGKDAATGKLTAVSVFGIKKTKLLIDETYTSIVKMLKIFDNNSFFNGFYECIKNRNN